MSEGLPRYHQVFARAAVENGGLGIVMRVNGVDVGSAIGYVVGGSTLTLGVIYYVYVKGDYRGLGFGKVVIASTEEILANRGAKIYLASTTGDNVISQKLFESMGYKILEWSVARYELGYNVLEAIEAIAPCNCFGFHIGLCGFTCFDVTLLL